MLLDGLRQDTGVDLVYLGRFADGEQQLRIVVGGDPGLRLFEGDRSALEATFCWRIPQSIIPGVIRDTALEPGVANLPGRVEDGIGGYVSTPVFAAGGEAYGTICCITSGPLEGDGNEILRRVEMVANVIQPNLAALEAELASQEDVSSKLREFIAGRGLTTVFQPVVDMATGETMAYESLTRLRSDPTHGPDWWLQVAHGLGVGVDLELAMLHRAADSAVGAGFGVPVSLNASPSILESGTLFPILDAHRTVRFGVEVTEHAVVNDYDRLRSAVARIKERGNLLVIDDAGAGFASFRHVLELKPDVIKLDISLTRDIDKDPTRRSLAAALGDFAIKQQTWVVVEGVETMGEAQTLRELGYRYAQGYLFARPAPASELPAQITVAIATPGSAAPVAPELADAPRRELQPEELAQIRDLDGLPFPESAKAILLADDRGHYLGATPAALELLGYSLDQLLGLSVAEITADPHRDLFDPIWREFAQSHAGAGLYALKNARGEEIYIRYQARTNAIPGVHLSEIRLA
jgi:PAS domain S-box-containing protein